MAVRKAPESKTNTPEKETVPIDADTSKASESKTVEDSGDYIKTNTISATVTGMGSRFRLVNTSRNIFIFPITPFVRETILPSRHWDVPDEHVEHVKRCLKSNYYDALIGKGLLKVVDVTPSKLGEADLKAPKTPDAPRELTETSEHVTQAGFVKKD